MLTGMARDESDREDLLREATALVERIELEPSNAVGSRIVIGFRTADALSIFIDADPVYQFNTAGELRRAFVSGGLLKAERGRLISLQRVRLPHEVQLIRHDLTDEEQRTFLTEMYTRLHDLTGQLAAGRYTVIGQVPSDADVLNHVRKWLANHARPTIAKTPHLEAAGLSSPSHLGEGLGEGQIAVDIVKRQLNHFAFAHRRF